MHLVCLSTHYLWPLHNTNVYVQKKFLLYGSVYVVIRTFSKNVRTVLRQSLYNIWINLKIYIECCEITGVINYFAWNSLRITCGTPSKIFQSCCQFNSVLPAIAKSLEEMRYYKRIYSTYCNHIFSSRNPKIW